MSITIVSKPATATKTDKPATGKKASKKASKPGKQKRNPGREMEKVANKAGAKLGVLLGQTAGHETRPTVQASIYGVRVASAIRWMGHHGYSFRAIRNVLDSLGLADVKDNTIRCQVQSGQHHPDGIHSTAKDAANFKVLDGCKALVSKLDAAQKDTDAE